MADAVTPKLGLTKPEVGASRNSWGGKVNVNFDIIDNLLTDAPSNGKDYARNNAAWVVLDWASLDSKPATFAPSSHSHPQSEVTNLVADLALKAPLASPTFTGDPKAPTPLTADNDTSIATTAFVKAQGYVTSSGVTAVSGTAPVVSSGGNTPAISMAAATTSVNGYLTSADWNIFNSKQPLITAGTTAQYWRGDKTWQTLDKTAVGLANVDNTSDANKPVSTATQTALNLKEDKSAKGAANGYAPLDASAKIAAIYLPAYVDDVVEYDNLAAFPAVGTEGVIYLALDTNKTYRWGGSTYAEISSSPGSTDAVPEGATNKYYLASRALADVTWTTLTGKPSTFVPSAHSHPQSEVTNLVSDLALKAPLASPTFTGVPAAPTATAGASTTQIATTAFVTTADALKANLAGANTFTGVNTFNDTPIVKLGVDYYSANGVRFLENIAPVSYSSGVPNGYLKLVTPIRTSHSAMFSIDVFGYDYQAGETIDFTVVGYAYPTTDQIINIGFSNRSSIIKQVRLALEDRGAGYRVMVLALGDESAAGTSNQVWYYQKFAVNVRGWSGSGHAGWDETQFTWVTGETTLAAGYWSSANLNNLQLDAETGTLNASGAITAASFVGSGTGLTGVAPIASPTFTGDPKAPTPATADNDTSIATTAFVKAQGYVTSSGVTSVSGTAPVVSSGGTTPAISMAAATTSVNGYLTAADWNTFNSKQAGSARLTEIAALAITDGNIIVGNGTAWVAESGATARTSLGAEAAIAAGTTAQYWRGDKSWQTLDKTAVGLGNVANTAQVTSVSGTAPVVSSGGTTPAISMAAATTSVNGYLTSADWTTFNNKAPTANPTFTGKVTTAASAAGNAGIILPHGAAPTSPVNGDLWTTTAGVYARINGVTQGPFGAGGGTVTSVTGTAPVVSSGGTTPAISMAAATASVNGYLTSADWNTFNSKANLASPTFTGVPAAPTATAGTNTTQLATTAFVTAAVGAASSALTYRSQVLWNSGTAVEFTGLPAGIKRITLMFHGLSTNGSSKVIVQIGDSSGYATTGYSGTVINFSDSGTAGELISTSFQIDGPATLGAALTRFGTMVLTRGQGATSAIWHAALNAARSDSDVIMLMNGARILAGELDRIRVTTVNGTDTGDAGYINLLYEI